MIPQDSKIYRTITSVYGVTPKKIIKQTRWLKFNRFLYIYNYDKNNKINRVWTC
jgi:hypothetical protein